MKLIFSILAIFIAIPAYSSDADDRQVLIITEYQRQHILGEMRALLAGTQNILGALSNEDMSAVAEYARTLGTGMANKAESHLSSALPAPFMQLGMSVHKDFDKIAADAEGLRDPKHTLKQMSESMGKCISCHATYQIRIASSPMTQSENSDHEH